MVIRALVVFAVMTSLALAKSVTLAFAGEQLEFHVPDEWVEAAVDAPDVLTSFTDGRNNNTLLLLGYAEKDRLAPEELLAELAQRFTSQLRVINQPEAILGQINGLPAAYTLIELVLEEGDVEVDADAMLTVIRSDKAHYVIWTTTRVPMGQMEQALLLQIVRTFRIVND